MEYSKDYLAEAHKHSIFNRDEILKSEICGCFYCLATYNPTDITVWVDEDKQDIGQTAMCAKCELDCVIGSHSGFPVSDLSFLRQMNKSYLS